MKKTPNHNSSDKQKMVVFIIIFSFFALVSSFYLLQQYNIISGAGTSGTVNFTILQSQGPPSTLGNQVIKDKSKILSFKLEVIPKKVEIHLDQYAYSMFSLRLIHHTDFPFDLAFTSNIPILKILEPYVALDPGEEQDVFFQVETDRVGTFIGHITIEDVFVFKQIPALIQIDDVDFRVAVNILSSTKTVLPGQDISAEIVVSPLFSQNLTLHYSIQDSANKIYLTEDEALAAAGGESRFQKTFSLAEPLSYNDYFLVVTAEQVGKKASGADSFAVVDSLTPTEEYPAQIYHQSPLLFFLIVLLILLFHLLIMWKRKK